MSPQFSHLCQQADSIGDAFATGHLPHNMAWLGLTTMLWPSLSYSLPVTSFSEPQSLKITQKLYQGLLPKLGVAHSSPLSPSCPKLFVWSGPSLCLLGTRDCCSLTIFRMQKWPLCCWFPDIHNHGTGPVRSGVHHPLLSTALPTIWFPAH